jgi:hypothetical protein
MEKIESFGFLLADNLPGPFNLDLDFIKVSNLNHQFENVPLDSPEFQHLTKHLVDPSKQRVDNVKDDRILGFGGETGGRVFETPHGDAMRRWTSETMNRVDNPDWQMQYVREPARPKQQKTGLAGKRLAQLGKSE